MPPASDAAEAGVGIVGQRGSVCVSVIPPACGTVCARDNPVMGMAQRHAGMPAHVTPTTNADHRPKPTIRVAIHHRGRSSPQKAYENTSEPTKQTQGDFIREPVPCAREERACSYDDRGMSRYFRRMQTGRCNMGVALPSGRSIWQRRPGPHSGGHPSPRASPRPSTHRSVEQSREAPADRGYPVGLQVPHHHAIHHRIE